jgi:hypothetical protein
MYTARIMKLPWWAFMPSLIGSVAGTLFVGLAAYSLTLFRMPTSWLTLGGSAAAVSLVYAFLVWTIGLSRGDRQLVKSFFPSQMSKAGVALAAK